MDDPAVATGVRPEVLLAQGDSEELQAGSWLVPEPPEDGVEDVVGEVEGQLLDGAESLQYQDPTEPVDDIRLGEDARPGPRPPVKKGPGGVEAKNPLPLREDHEQRQKAERRRTSRPPGHLMTSRV